MSSSGSIGEEPAVFAHHVRALLARQRREDEEAIAGSLKRTGFRAQGDDRAARGPQRRQFTSHRERTVDFHAASPLTRRDRQTGGFRVPHFDVKAVVAIHPPSRNGVAHSRCGGGGMTAAAHFDYVTDGARIGLATHIDYIRRETGVADPAGEMLLDMLDEQEMRADLNQLACYTNIPGGWDRARSLFEAAERAAPPPKSHLLQASTAQVTSFEYQLKFGGAPIWFREMTRRLQAEAAEVEREAIERGRPERHRMVTIAEVSGEEAYERLDWFERRRFARDLISWKQGRTRRSQHRFVGELPDGLSAIDRHDILSRFCDSSADDGWMVVGAIHQPDRHNDRRNFHIHVDAVDRPAEWLDAHGCWDFEYVERRNGKVTHPKRQNKVRYDAPPAGILRERFITIVNEGVGDRQDIVRYLHGTYADNGIGLTPLDHMGNRAIGLESRGIETEVGSRNARRIFADEAAACEKRANEADAALASEVALIRTIVANDLAAVAALERYERLERRLIRRRLQRELAAVVITMARSRAETVVHTLTPTPGRPVTPRKGDGELLADARAHLAWVERNSPTPDEREAARRVEEALAARAADQWAIVQSATARLGQAPAMDVVVYVPRQQAPAAAATASRFDGQKRDRLRAWLRKHAADGALLIFDNGDARLGRNVPKAIDRLMRQFAQEPSFQRLLLAERHRRADREMLSGFAPSKATPSTSPVSGKPRPIARRSGPGCLVLHFVAAAVRWPVQSHRGTATASFRRAAGAIAHHRVRRCPARGRHRSRERQGLFPGIAR
ncbi:hypothetical protein DMC47_22265 [Nostoc sp. 3335mG]|nr:hypothetical protein DMC47_22265 [Nostoc sp. 3335mG]